MSSMRKHRYSFSGGVDRNVATGQRSGCVLGGDSGGAVYTVRPDGGIAAKGNHEPGEYGQPVPSALHGCASMLGRASPSAVLKRPAVIVATAMAAVAIAVIALAIATSSAATITASIDSYSRTSDPRVIVVRVNS